MQGGQPPVLQLCEQDCQAILRPRGESIPLQEYGAGDASCHGG